MPACCHLYGSDETGCRAKLRILLLHDKAPCHRECGPLSVQVRGPSIPLRSVHMFYYITWQSCWGCHLYRHPYQPPGVLQVSYQSLPRCVGHPRALQRRLQVLCITRVCCQYCKWYCGHDWFGHRLSDIVNMDTMAMLKLSRWFRIYRPLCSSQKGHC